MTRANLNEQPANRNVAMFDDYVKAFKALLGINWNQPLTQRTEAALDYIVKVSKTGEKHSPVFRTHYFELYHTYISQNKENTLDNFGRNYTPSNFEIYLPSDNKLSIGYFTGKLISTGKRRPETLEEKIANSIKGKLETLEKNMSPANDGHANKRRR